MKNLTLMLTVAGAIALTSCGSMAGLSGYYYDDVYYNPKTDAREVTYAEPDNNADSFLSAAAKTDYGTSDYAETNPNTDSLALADADDDDEMGEYERRLQRFGDNYNGKYFTDGEDEVEVAPITVNYYYGYGSSLF